MKDIEIPKVLYHYTTQEGISGIFKEKELWATKIHYMNDATELMQPLNFVRLNLIGAGTQFDIDRMKRREPDKGEAEIFQKLVDEIEQWEDVNICVISLCKKGDLLSQWRGYGIYGSAYSIGFDTEILKNSIEKYKFEIRKCGYHEQEEYQKKIKDFVNKKVEEALKIGGVPHGFVGDFIRMASTMKLKCFEEEDEWRIVSWEPMSYSDHNFRFRCGKSMIIPYYALPLEYNSISEIYVGPCQNPELAQKAIYGMANKFQMIDFKKEQIKISNIPYRVL